MVKQKLSETYSKRSASVKPTLAQERDLQLIEKEEGITRSKIMRAALKDYLAHKRLKQVGRDLRKDPTQILLEKVLAEQLDPLRRRVESLAAILQTFQTLSASASPASSTANLSFTLKPETDTRGALPDAVLSQLKFLCKLTEQHFHDTMITQRIVAYFLIEQHVRVLQPDETACLALVEQVRHHTKTRSETAAQVFSLIRAQMNGVAQRVINDYKREEGLECVVPPSAENEQPPSSNLEAVAAT